MHVVTNAGIRISWALKCFALWGPMHVHPKAFPSPLCNWEGGEREGAFLSLLHPSAGSFPPFACLPLLLAVMWLDKLAERGKFFFLHSFPLSAALLSLKQGFWEPDWLERMDEGGRTSTNLTLVMSLFPALRVNQAYSSWTKVPGKCTRKEAMLEQCHSAAVSCQGGCCGISGIGHASPGKNSWNNLWCSL